MLVFLVLLQSHNSLLLHILFHLPKSSFHIHDGNRPTILLHKLHQIYRGRLTDKKWLDLQCDKEKCIYQNKAALYKKGGLILDDIDYTAQGALSVFNISSMPQIYLVKKSVGKRYWSSLIQ